MGKEEGLDAEVDSDPISEVSFTDKDPKHRLVINVG